LGRSNSFEKLSQGSINKFEAFFREVTNGLLVCFGHVGNEGFRKFGQVTVGKVAVEEGMELSHTPHHIGSHFNSELAFLHCLQNPVEYFEVGLGEVDELHEQSRATVFGTDHT
jgi:hypothetical protein